MEVQALPLRLFRGGGRGDRTCPIQVRRLYEETFPQANRLPLSMAAIELAGLYVQQGVVTQKYLSDARHVAVCAEAGIIHLVSWNFRHLVNVEREAGFNTINLQGYR